MAGTSQVEVIGIHRVLRRAPVLAQEISSRFATRIEGTCIKHRFGKTGVKMYDKFGFVLRLETTTFGSVERTSA